MNFDLEKLSYKSKIVVVGKTGSGKSHICREFLSGGDEYFIPDEDLKSFTREFAEKEVFLFGNDGNPKIKLVDTIGFDDNVVDELIFEKYGKFCKSWEENGINLMLFTVDILNPRLDISPFRMFYSFYGDFYDRIAVVLMKGDQIAEKFYEKRVSSYRKDAEALLKENQLMGIDKNLVIFDYYREKEQLMSFIENRIVGEKDKKKQQGSIPKTIKKKEVFNNKADNEEAFFLGHKNYPQIVEPDLKKAENKVELLEKAYNKNPNEENKKKLDEANGQKNRLFYGKFTQGMIFVNDVFQLGKNKFIEKFVKESGKKAMTKYIPAIGMLIGLGRGAYRIYCDKNQWKKALCEMGGGAMSLIPMIGPWASVGVDALIYCDDKKKAVEEEKQAQKQENKVQEEENKNQDD